MAGKVFEFGSKEELFNLLGDFNCPYCTKTVQASPRHLASQHLRYAIHYSVAGIGRFSIPCYCAEEKRDRRSHWHCTKCPKVIHRTTDFRAHLSHHAGVQLRDKLLDAEEASEGTSGFIEPIEDYKSSCQKCDTLVAHHNFQSPLRKQKMQQNCSQEQPMICVDAKNGIYVTPKDLQGAKLPIHVCKSLVSQSFLCELETCREFMTMASQNGNPGKECYHLERTRNAQCYSPPPPMCNFSLQDMAEKGIISKLKQQECMTLHAKACLEEVDCVFPIFWEEPGAPERYFYFSVYSDQNDTWCKFGRTLVTLDTSLGKWHWHCQCTQQSCVHQHISMWWIFQERPCWRKHIVSNSELIEAVETKEIELEEMLQIQHSESACH
ncbi:uncharacterized protein [Hoplias malabaricus]|uniref:uncharacterized protein n=1 Tax=Hoplias malabaricus TaxID=27720 RepID=UPI003462E440